MVKFRSIGFTMIELMVAIVIVAILSTIAITSYNVYTLNSRRSTAQANLEEIISFAQQYFIQNNAYPSNGAAGTAFPSLPTTITNSPYYTYTVNNTCGTNCFLAQAVVTGGQASDTGCSCMQLDTNGNQHAYNTTTCSGTDNPANCWKQ